MRKRKSILASIANRASTTVLKSPKTHAMTVSQNPAIQIPTNQLTMKAKTILDAEKKDTIDIATELCYSEEVKRKITQAKSVYEIGRILKQARLDQE
jgi:hypothetical protein